MLTSSAFQNVRAGKFIMTVLLSTSKVEPHDMKGASVLRADRILKIGLFTGNLAQPKRLEPRQFLSQLAHPLKGFGKPSGPKEVNKIAAFTAGGIGADRKSSLLSSGRTGPENDEERSNGGRRSGEKNKRQIVFAIGAAGILAVPLQEMTDDDNEKSCEKQSVPADLAQLVIASNSTDPQIQFSAVKTIRESLRSAPDPVVDTLVSSNILPTLVNCLSSQIPALQFEAAATLTNIAATESRHTQAVVQAGAVPHLLKLLTSPNQQVRDVAVVTLGHIMSDGPKLRDYVINLGVMAPLLNWIQSDIPLTLLRHVPHVFATICRYKDAPPPAKTLQEILSALNFLIHHDDTEVLAYTVCALWQLTEIGNEHIQMVIDSGVLPKLVQLLSHPEVEVQKVAARAVRKIVSGTEHQTQAVRKCDVLSHLHNLLKHPNKDICKDALVILSMFSYGNCARVQAVIDAGFIPLIIAHLEKGDVQTKIAAAFAVFGMALSGNKEQVAHLIDCGVIPPICNLLNDRHPQVIEVIMYGIQRTLMNFVNQSDQDRVRAGSGGLDKIEPKRNHENKEIGVISCNITENCVSDNVEEDSNLVPEVAGNARQSNPI